MLVYVGSGRALRIALPIVATVAIVAPLAWLWQDSRVPAAYSVMEMGYPDYGVGPCLIPASAGTGGHMQGHRCPATRWRRHGWSPIWLPTRHDQPTYGWIW